MLCSPLPNVETNLEGYHSQYYRMDISPSSQSLQRPMLSQCYNWIWTLTEEGLDSFLNWNRTLTTISSWNWTKVVQNCQIQEWLPEKGIHHHILPSRQNHALPLRSIDHYLDPTSCNLLGSFTQPGGAWLQNTGGYAHKNKDLLLATSLRSINSNPSQIMS